MPVEKLYNHGDVLPSLDPDSAYSAKTRICREGKIYKLHGTSQEPISWSERKRWTQLGVLILKVAKCVLIYPLFTKSYYHEIQKAYVQLGKRSFFVYVEDNCPWWQSLLTKIDPETYKDKKLLPQLEKIAKYIESECLRLIEQHEDPWIKEEFMGHNYTGSLLGWSFKMPGLALVAAYLKEKHQIEGMEVCQTLGAFQQKLTEISKTPEDVRLTLIIPVRACNTGKIFPQSQHKIAICIEKVGASIKIAVMDSEPINGNEIHRPALLTQSAQDIGERFLSSLEVVFWHICHSKLDWAQTTLYTSQVLRERHYGCETFALQDALAFAECPDFFDCIVTGEKEIVLPIGTLKPIIAFPPEFMKGTQSISAIQTYIHDYPELANRPFPHRKEGQVVENWTLQECLDAHTIKVGEKDQNHYTSYRTYKYHLLALKALECLTTEELKEIMLSALLTDDRKQLQEGEIPQTLDDLHDKFENEINHRHKIPELPRMPASPT